VNTNFVKMRKSGENFVCQGHQKTVHIPYNTVYVKFTKLHRRTMCTSNMAAVTVIERITSVSSHISESYNVQKMLAFRQ